MDADRIVSDTAQIEFIVMNERINVYIFHFGPDSGLYRTHTWLLGEYIFGPEAGVSATGMSCVKKTGNMTVIYWLRRHNSKIQLKHTYADALFRDYTAVGR